MRTVVLAGLLFFAVATRAAAAPVVIGQGDLPDVTVDAAGTAYIAWTGNEASNPTHFCRLPRGATACDVALTLPLPVGALGSTTRPAVQVSGARVSVLAHHYGQTTQITQYVSTDGGATFPSSRIAGGDVPIYDSLDGPGDAVSVITQNDGRGLLFEAMPLAAGPPPAGFAVLDAARPYYGAVGLDGQNPLVIAETSSSIGVFRRYVRGDVNDAASWSAAVDIGYLDYPRLAGGPLGLFVMAGDETGGLFVRRFDGTTFGPRVPVGPGDASEMSLFQDAAGRLHAVYPRLDASGYHAVHAVSDDGVNWRMADLEVLPFVEHGHMRVSTAADHVGVAAWRSGGDIAVSAVGPDVVPVPPVVQPPTVLPPAPEPVPEFQKTVVVRPVSGKIRVRLRGSSRFVDLTTLDDVPLGATIDAKRGTVELRSVPARGAPVQSVQLFDGMFKVTQTRGITDFALNEPLAACSKRARAAAKKPKTRQLWGNGKGAFRTTGNYSAATVRGTKWLVRDSCAGTLTRVTQGSVSVRNKVLRKTVVVRAKQSYTARPRR